MGIELSGGLSLGQHNALTHGQFMRNNVILNPLRYSAIGAGAWGPRSQIDFLFNSVMQNDVGAANLDNITYTVNIPEGLYHVRLWCRGNPNFAIMDLDLNGAEIGSIDLYRAVDTNNIIFQILNQTFLNGDNIIRLRVDGRNGLSGGWVVGYACIDLAKVP